MNQQEAKTTPSPETAWLNPEIAEGERKQEAIDSVLGYLRETNPELAERLLQATYTVIVPSEENSGHWLQAAILFGESETRIGSIKERRNNWSQEIIVMELSSPDDPPETIYRTLTIKKKGIKTHRLPDGRFIKQDTSVGTKYQTDSITIVGSTSPLVPHPEVTGPHQVLVEITKATYMHISYGLFSALLDEGLNQSWGDDLIIVQEFKPTEL